MERSESIANLAKAVIAVMASVKGIEKSMEVGSGNMSYKGVPDQEVKKIIGDAMAANGLCMLPIGIQAKTEVSRWEEVGNYGPKQKQSVFTEVNTKYMLLHESGEWQELEGYGHGVDSQDKGAGKATTYALKYALLYTFLVPTGKIDDADQHHSESIETAPKPKPGMSKKQFEKLLARIEGGDLSASDSAAKHFTLTPEQIQDMSDAYFAVQDAMINQSQATTEAQ